MPGYPIDKLVRFSEINTGELNWSFWDRSCKADLERRFDLAQEYEWLLDSEGEAKDLEDANFGIPLSTVL